MGFRYPQPDNEYGFEQLCLRLYRKVWQNESLKLYAKRGEKQDGVDIFDPLCVKPIRAVQCKHHEPTKTILPSEIKSEVQKAEGSHFEIERYVIATTARRSREAQNAVAELNKRPSKKFTVDIHFWEEICQHASELGRVLAELIIYGENILAGAPADASHSTPSPVFSSSRPESSDANEPYGSIEKLINDQRLEVAQHELDKLPNADSAKSLPLTEQYKLLRLRAKLALENGQFEVAGQMFLEAYAVSPDLDQAKQNRVLGHYLLGNASHAQALAQQYVAEGLRTPVMILRLIDSVTSQEELAQHATIIDALVETDDSINTALAHKYLLFGDFDRATDAADRAVKIRPESPHAHLAAAFCAHRPAFSKGRGKRHPSLVVALKHYDAAESLATEQRLANLLPEILVNRAAARMLARDTAGAAADYREAVAVAKQPAVYVEPAMAFFLQEGDFDSVRTLLPLLDRTSLEGEYLACVTEYRNSGRDRKRALIDDMAHLADQKWDRAVESRFQCVQWAIDLDEYALAESFVPQSFREEHPFQAHTMLAWILGCSHDKDGANTEALAALGEGVRSAHPQEVRLLASILVTLHEDSGALGLLEQLALPGVLDQDMKSLITCAQRLDRHDLLLRICQELRTAGILDEQLLKLEVQITSRYLPRDAMSLAQELASKSTHPSYFIAAKNLLAVRLNELKNVTLDATLLPAPEDLSPGEADMMVLPYVAMEKYDDALRFLYAQRRLYFEDEHAHGRYIFFFLAYGQKTTLQSPPSVVSPDAAVLLESDRSEQRWVVLEDEHPVASRSEFSSECELARSILGRVVDDALTLPGNLVQPHVATIREIQTKYVRAFQDGIQHFVTRFPGTSILQQLHVGDGEAFNPAAIIASLQSRREHVEKCIGLYRDLPCSVYLFAERVGLTELEAVKALARHPDGFVRCCQISPEGFHKLAHENAQAQVIVLSMSAIITLSLIDGWRYLDSTATYLISQLTSEVIDSWIHEAREFQSKEGGIVNLDAADQLVYRETTEEERVSHLDELRAIRDAVDARCERVSSLAVAQLPAEKRGLYQQFMGMHNVEAMSVAKDRGGALWSDDAVVGFVAATDFGVANVWSQLVLRCNVEKGFVSSKEFDVISAKLACWHYVNTMWNAAALIAAGEHAGWDLQVWPLSECFGLIAKSEIAVPHKARIVLEFLLLLRRSDCRDLKQSAIIQACLNALGEPTAVRWILGRIDQAFGVDIPSARFVRVELEFWLRLR